MRTRARVFINAGVLSFVLLLMLALAASGPPASASQPASPAAWEAKVAPELLEALVTEETVEFIVMLRQQADLSEAADVSSKEQKGRIVYERLTATARQTQQPLLQQLRATGADFRAYWIANMVWVRGDAQALQTAAAHAAVERVYANPYRRLEAPLQPAIPKPHDPGDVEWNISHIGAPEVWALGYRGQGAVVGGQDTGYDWDHPALIEQYRGWDGSSAQHDYNWHDAIHSNGGVCGADSAEPCDDNGHGTHTMGTIVGDDGAGNEIGVAPEAKWIGCRNMDRGVGSPITYSECFQWFLAPTNGDGENADPSMAPHVINNSWACPPSEACTEATILQTVVESVRAAGIMVVASAGNSGAAGCGSVRYPPAIYDASFSVGATDSADQIASFSSRGPVTVDGSNRLKPDIVAPGVSVRSAIPGGHYGFNSGTSMAAPHVSGLAALLISANPTLIGQVDTLEWAIRSSAVALTSVENCGGVAGSEIPNNTFGHGRIDAQRAYERVQMTVYRTLIPFSAVPGAETSSLQHN